MGGADDDIRDAVEDQLTFDPDVDAAESDITVETMKVIRAFEVNRDVVTAW